MTDQPSGDRPVLEALELRLRLGGTPALDGVTLEVGAGEIVAVVGPSGCGKSTLLHVLSGILVPDSGQVNLSGSRLDVLSDADRSRVRLRRSGFVFQFGDLVPELTMEENVALPLRLLGRTAREARDRALEALDKLKIADLRHRRPGEVSGGQLQRAAIARATVHSPDVVFADEPTGALDSDAGKLVLDSLLAMAADLGTAVVLVTHEAHVAAAARSTIRMRDGRIDCGDRSGLAGAST